MKAGAGDTVACLFCDSVLTRDGAGFRLTPPRAAPGSRRRRTVLRAIAFLLAYGGISDGLVALVQIHGWYGQVAIRAAVLAGAGAIAFGFAEITLAGALLAALVGAMLVAKPFVAPVVSDYGDVHTTFGITSETHLHYLIPGALLLGLSALLLANRRR